MASPLELLAERLKRLEAESEVEKLRKELETEKLKKELEAQILKKELEDKINTNRPIDVLCNLLSAQKVVDNLGESKFKKNNSTSDGKYSCDPAWFPANDTNTFGPTPNAFNNSANNVDYKSPRKNFFNQSVVNDTSHSQPCSSRPKYQPRPQQQCSGYNGPRKNHSSQREQTVMVKTVSQNSSGHRRHHDGDNSRSTTGTFVKVKSTESQGGQKNYSAGKNFHPNAKNYDKTKNYNKNDSQQKPFHKKPQNRVDNPGNFNRNPQNQTVIINKTVVIHQQQSNTGNRNSETRSKVQVHHKVNNN